MLVKISLTEDEIRQAISRYIQDKTSVFVEHTDVKIQVKSEQNYKAEWENARIRCDFEAKVKD